MVVEFLVFPTDSNQWTQRRDVVWEQWHLRYWTSYSWHSLAASPCVEAMIMMIYDDSHDDDDDKSDEGGDVITNDKDDRQ